MKACPAGCDGGLIPNGTCTWDTCDRCDGEGSVESWYDRLPGARGLRRQYHVRRYMLDRRLERARHWRGLIRDYRRDPHCSTVAAYQPVHRNMLDDAPMLRSLVENQLKRDVIDHTPLRWRVEAARRAMRGDLVDPYEYLSSVTVSTQHADWFTRDQAVVLLEVHRRLKQPPGDIIRVDAPLSPEAAADLKAQFAKDRQ